MLQPHLLQRALAVAASGITACSHATSGCFERAAGRRALHGQQGIDQRCCRRRCARRLISTQAAPTRRRRAVRPDVAVGAQLACRAAGPRAVEQVLVAGQKHRACRGLAKSEQRGAGQRRADRSVCGCASRGHEARLHRRTHHPGSGRRPHCTACMGMGEQGAGERWGGGRSGRAGRLGEWRSGACIASNSNR